MKKIYLFKRYERLWHWAQAALVLTLVATGFDIHGTWTLCGFETAVRVHEACGVSLVVLTLFTMFWHTTTGEHVHFIPTRRNLDAQIRFYTSGIFRGEDHPEIPTPENKFNPLQKAAYFALLVLVFPVQLAAGILYLGTPAWPDFVDRVGGLRTIALVHTAAAFATLSFIIVHVYMIMTGRTLGANVKAMITGYVEHEQRAAPVGTSLNGAAAAPAEKIALD